MFDFLLLFLLSLLLFLLLFLSLLFFVLFEHRPRTRKALLSNIPPQSEYFLEMIITEPVYS